MSRMEIDGKAYEVEVLRRKTSAPEVPRLLIVSFLPRLESLDVLSVCLDGIQQFTPEEHEVWVIDNHSPEEFSNKLREREDINIVFNRTTPKPGSKEPESWWRRVFCRQDKKSASDEQMEFASYANAVGLELGLQAIPEEVHYVMTMHMDTMPCRSNWLAHLKSKLNDQVKLSGVRLDKARVSDGVIHVLGMLIDYRAFRSLDLDFFPDLPDYDVGDRVTVEFRKHGYQVVHCPNSLRDPDALSRLDADSIFHEYIVDRSVDDEGEVVFLHMGRGVRKSVGRKEKGLTIPEWVEFSKKLL
ncbi:MAG: hypothetical protein AAF571_10280 [Verrucomicrobiota bacterium]